MFCVCVLKPSVGLWFENKIPSFFFHFCELIAINNKQNQQIKINFKPPKHCKNDI